MFLTRAVPKLLIGLLNPCQSHQITCQTQNQTITIPTAVSSRVCYNKPACWAITRRTGPQDGMGLMLWGRDPTTMDLPLIGDHDHHRDSAEGQDQGLHHGHTLGPGREAPISLKTLIGGGNVIATAVVTVSQKQVLAPVIEAITPVAEKEVDLVLLIIETIKAGNKTHQGKIRRTLFRRRTRKGPTNKGTWKRNS